MNTLLVLTSVALLVATNAWSYTFGKMQSQREVLGGIAKGTITYANVNADLIPDGNNTRDIGAFGTAYNDLFVSGTTRIATTTIQGSLTPTLNNVFTLGAFGSAWGNVHVSGTMYATTTRFTDGNLGTPSISWVNDPDTGFYKSSQGSGMIFSVDGLNYLSWNGAAGTTATNTSPFGLGLIDSGRFFHDLSGQGPWKNIYASSSVFMASSTVFQASNTSTIFLDSGTAFGGRIVFKGPGTTCYQLYFGDAGGAGGGPIGLTTSTVTCPK